MSQEFSQSVPDLEGVLERLSEVRQSSEAPQQFWKACLDTLAKVVGAEFGLLLLRDGDSWKKIGVWPVDRQPTMADKPLIDDADELGAQAEQQRWAFKGFQQGGWAIAARLQTLGGGAEVCVAAFRIASARKADAEHALEKLCLVADTPAHYQRQQEALKAQQDVEHFASALDLNVVLNDRKRFLEVALTLCNELCARHHCDQVNLGWLVKDQYIRLQAISHMEKFDRKMEAVRSLEIAMEECLEQDEEIVLPRVADSTQITRDHEKLKADQDHPFICSLPIRVDGKPEAVVTCQRLEGEFQEQEVRLLRICCDLAARRLSELKKNDRWFGARWLARTRAGLAKCVGTDHTWEKVFSVVGIVALGFLAFGTMPYRVEAPFILKSDAIQYVPAPFDGHIAEVGVEVGDGVDAGTVLLELDKRDLLLEEASALADQHRFLREVEKSRAANDLAGMRIAESQAEQATARLELVHHRLQQAAIKPRFDGVLVEGDLKERLGAPVKAGEVLFRIARVDQMYVQCEVAERDVHELSNETITGQIAFASNPKDKYPVTVERIDPITVNSADGNVFQVRCTFTDAPESWWRPGMSGICKLDLGRRNNWWIVSHRTVDFLRMKLWW
jgi:hypothetical protein